MKKIDSTSARSNTLASLADAILKENCADFHPAQSILIKMRDELAERGECHAETAKRHIRKALLRALGQPVKARGGYRGQGAGFGRPKKSPQTDS